jgi:uncharacterized protein (TIGR03435 family)
MKESATNWQGFSRMLLLAVAVVIPIVVGIVNASPHQPPSVQNSPRSLDTPKWEAVSIKRCILNGGSLVEGRGGTPVGRGGGPPRSSPGRVDFPCSTVNEMIGQAYFIYADGKRNSLPFLRIDPEIGAGLAWIKSDRYEIHAKAEGTPSEGTMMGPMLQALLQDRFKLKVRHETREVPVYALRVAKNGFKLSAVPDGSCEVRDRRKTPLPRLASDGLTEILQPGEKPTCGRIIFIPKGAGAPNQILFAQATSLADFASTLLPTLDRAVVDKTAIKGMFNFRLEFAFEDPANPRPPAEPSVGTSVFTAVQEQLGLKLESTKGPGEFLIIDHVERPTEN